MTLFILVPVISLFAACPGPKPAPAAPPPTPTPTVAAATPEPTPLAPASPTPEIARYSGAQQAEYIKTAQNGFVVARGAKSEAFALAYTDFIQAGGASAKGLSSKEVIAARRALIEKSRLANEEYLAFIGTQDETYRQELSKTPLLKSDVDSLVEDFSKKVNGESLKKLRENKREILKASDDMMAYLDKKFGAWKLSGDNAVFKIPADANGYSALGKKYNGFVQAEQKLKADTDAPLPTPSDSPIASVSPGPAGGVAPAATVAPPMTSPKANSTP